MRNKKENVRDFPHIRIQSTLVVGISNLYWHYPLTTRFNLFHFTSLGDLYGADMKRLLQRIDLYRKFSYLLTVEKREEIH